MNTVQFCSVNDCDAGPEEGHGKGRAGMLRHSRTATTTDVYMQEIPASVQATVKQLK
jgi:hypothetical protein